MHTASTEQNSLIVTTATSASRAAVARSREIASDLSSECVPRRNGGGGLMGMLDEARASRAVIVEENGLAIAHRDGTVFRWHPNMGFVRAFNLMRGQADTFAEATQLKAGERVLDCTLGFAGEALIAALLVGESGEVVGLESARELALITSAGLRERVLSQPELKRAASRISVVYADYRSYLDTLEADRFDVICFDPFFDQRTEGSAMNIEPLRRFGDTSPLDAVSVIAAVRLARRLVVVKHPLGQELPAQLVEARNRIVKAKRGLIRYSIFDGTGGLRSSRISTSPNPIG